MLNVNGLKLQEYANNIFRATLPKDKTLQDILDKEYYRHVAGKLSAGDEITFVKEDYSEYFKLIVVGTPDKTQPQLWASVKLISHVVLDKEVEKTVGELKIQKNVKDNKFKVTKSDKTTIAEFDTKEEADIFAESF